MKILLAVDGSPYTQKMLAYLTSHQEMLGTDHQYTVITVQPVLPPRVRSVLGKTSVEQYYSEESEKIRAGHRVPRRARRAGAETLSRVGPIADTIIDVAKTAFDLIMMGTHGHGALGRLS